MTTPASSDRDDAANNDDAAPSALRLVDTDPAELEVDAIVVGVNSQDANSPSP